MKYKYKYMYMEPMPTIKECTVRKYYVGFIEIKVYNNIGLFGTV